MPNQDALKQAMANIYSQNPVDRLHALEQTEPIYDTSAQLVGNANLLGSSGSAAIPILRILGALNGVQDFRNAKTTGQKANAVIRGVSPYLPMFHNKVVDAIRTAFPKLDDAILPYIQTYMK